MIEYKNQYNLRKEVNIQMRIFYYKDSDRD